MNVSELLQRIKADADDALSQLATSTPPPPPAPAGTPIGTVAELLAAFKAGGTYQLRPGTYAGNFVARVPITLTGTPDAILQPADTFTPPLQVLGATATDILLRGFTVKNGEPDRECVVVGDFNATSVGQQPQRVTIDGLVIAAGPRGGHRAIALHGSSLTVKNSRVTGFYEIGRDSQAVFIHNGPGPYTVIDNYLEASGETILTGGSPIRIPNCLPSDILIARNVCFKPQAWRGQMVGGIPVVKNSIELKIGRRVTIEDNMIDGNWRSGQDGTPIVFTVRNQEGDTPWATIADVVCRRNVTKNCPEGFAVSILGLDDEHPSVQASSIELAHNLFADSPSGVKVGNGVAGFLKVLYNTMPAIKGTFLSFYTSGSFGKVQTPITVQGNVTKSGAYGIMGDGSTGPGTPSLALTSVVAFAGNVIEKSADRGIPYPAGNTLVPVGGLAALIDPSTFKLLTGDAGY
jgi:hypothetical protein